MKDSQLAQKAMLVRVRIGQWTASLKDRKVSRKAAADAGAGADAGRYQKQLMDKQTLKPLRYAEAAARGFHKANTLPWDDGGQRILPSANFQHYTRTMGELREQFDEEVRRFVQAYEEAVGLQAPRLGQMFNRDEYPALADIEGRYSFQIEITPLPCSKDFRVEISDDEANRIRQQIAVKAQRHAQQAMADLYRRLHEAVQHIAERLTGTDERGQTKVFRDSMVENLRSLVDVMPRLNLLNDPELMTLRDEVHVTLCRTTPKMLRRDAGERNAVLSKANEMLAKIKRAWGDKGHDQNGKAPE